MSRGLTYFERNSGMYISELPPKNGIIISNNINENNVIDNNVTKNKERKYTKSIVRSNLTRMELFNIINSNNITENNSTRNELLFINDKKRFAHKWEKRIQQLIPSKL